MSPTESDPTSTFSRNPKEERSGGSFIGVRGFLLIAFFTIAAFGVFYVYGCSNDSNSANGNSSDSSAQKASGSRESREGKTASDSRSSKNERSQDSSTREKQGGREKAKSGDQGKADAQLPEISAEEKIAQAVERLSSAEGQEIRASVIKRVGQAVDEAENDLRTKAQQAAQQISKGAGEGSGRTPGLANATDEAILEIDIVLNDVRQALAKIAGTPPNETAIQEQKWKQAHALREQSKHERER